MSAAAGTARRVAAITGTRADYGPMQPVFRAIAADPALGLDLIVTGMHFLPQFATGLAQIRADGFGVLHEVPVPTGDDSTAAMATTIGHMLVAFSETFERLRPDILLLQGDRGEMLAGAIAAAHMGIAIVHMSGGDVSGSIDDPVRDAISRFAHFHLVNSEASRTRLLAIGEDPARVLVVGEPGLDQLLSLDLLGREQLERDYDLPAGEPFLVATLHPTSDEAGEATAQMTTLLGALDGVGMPVVFTHPNSDAGGEAMRVVLDGYTPDFPLRIVPNLGSLRYLSLVRSAAAVIGNSSSGLFDTPALRVPAVNIGNRQRGRARATNVIDAPFDRAAIAQAIRHALTDADLRRTLATCVSPFGDGKAAARTVAVLKYLRRTPSLFAKWQPAAEPLLSQAVDGV